MRHGQTGQTHGRVANAHGIADLSTSAHVGDEAGKAFVAEIGHRSIDAILNRAINGQRADPSTAFRQNLRTTALHSTRST